MSINKNDCLDCNNSVNKCRGGYNWVCTKGHTVPQDENGIVEVLNDDCEDFEYQE